MISPGLIHSGVCQHTGSRILPNQPQPLSDALFDEEVGADLYHDDAIVSGVGFALGHRNF